MFADLLVRSLDEAGHEVVDVFDGSEPDLVADIVEVRPQLVLLDLHLAPPRHTSVPLLSELVDAGLQVIVVTASDERLEHAACLEAGAEGFVRKSASIDELRRAIGDALAGRPVVSTVDRMSLMIDLRLQRETDRRQRQPFDRLTNRETEVLRHLCDGHSAAEIAELSFVSLATVRTQIRSILSKLGVGSQLAAVGRARRTGWLND